MSTLSVPLTPDLEKAIEDLVKRGEGSNKAAVARKAIERFAEEKAMSVVFESERELHQGKILKGDLKKLVSTLP